METPWPPKRAVIWVPLHMKTTQVTGSLSQLKIKPVQLEDNLDENTSGAPSCLLYLLSKLSGH